VTEASPRFRRILVPVDLSLRSADALRYAVAFGSRHQAQIDVLHVWHSDLTIAVTAARDRAKSALREFVGALGLEGNVALRRHTDHGDPYLTIQRVARLAGHDLIAVAGPEANRGNADSLALSLLATAPSAVLFVPPNCRPRFRSPQDRALRLERLLVPLALAGAELEALACAEALAEPDHAAVEVLLSTDVARAQLERFRAPHPAWRGEELSEALEVASAVRKRAQAAPPDLLVFCGERAQVGARPSDLAPQRIALGEQCPSLCLAS
jgi:nucleotide-binding universal stress UspA family protein